MKKYISLVIVVILSTVFYACSDSITGTQNPYSLPKTFITLYPDSGTVSQQQSKLQVHWWGDSPDGLIVGYYLSLDNATWKFTTSTDSTIAFTIRGLDTLYDIRVAAVDNHGNHKFDQHVYYKGQDLGSEPYQGKDSGVTYHDGLTYVDLGNIDPNPAVLKLPLKNTPPAVSFIKDKYNAVINIPETTYTAASFGWDASDLDGNETITKIYIALNDTTQKIELPGNTRYFTLIGNSSSSSVTDCKVFLGNSVNSQYASLLPNLKLNSNNILYVWAEDIAGAKSSVKTMPDSTSSIKWYVKKPVGQVLIIDDYAVNDETASFYYKMMDSLGLGSKYSVLDLGYGKTSTARGNLLPKILNPMFTETLKLFKTVIWYTDNNPTIEAAQASIKNYTDAGGKVLLSFQFPVYFDTYGISDFLPIDSIDNNNISLLPKGTDLILQSTGSSLNYPNLKIDQSTIPVVRVRPIYPNPDAADVLYTINYGNQPTISFRVKGTNSNLIYLGLPINRLNGLGTAKAFLQKVLFGEFGVSK